MARIKTSGLISNISGSVSGATFQNSQSGLIMRTKPLPINPKSSAQNSQRVNIFNLQNTWINLLPDQRYLWQTFATYAKQQQKNNADRYLSGQQFFLRINSTRLMKGLEILTEPLFTTYALAFLKMTFDYIQIYVWFTGSRNIDENIEFLTLSMSAPVSPAINSFNMPMRNIELGTLDSDDRYDVAPGYKAVYGIYPDQGYNIHYKYALHDIYSGLCTPLAYGIIPQPE